MNNTDLLNIVARGILQLTGLSPEQIQTQLNQRTIEAQPKRTAPSVPKPGTGTKPPTPKPPTPGTGKGLQGLSNRAWLGARQTGIINNTGRLAGPIRAAGGLSRMLLNPWAILLGLEGSVDPNTGRTYDTSESAKARGDEFMKRYKLGKYAPGYNPLANYTGMEDASGDPSPPTNQDVRHQQLREQLNKDFPAARLVPTPNLAPVTPKVIENKNPNYMPNPFYN